MISEYKAPTVEQWHAIADGIRSFYPETMLEGGGAACPFIQVAVSNGRVVVLGDVNETWNADVYDSAEDMAEGETPSGYLDLEIATGGEIDTDVIALKMVELIATL